MHMLFCAFVVRIQQNQRFLRQGSYIFFVSSVLNGLCAILTLSLLKCCLLITFANSLDPDQAHKMSGLIWIQIVTLIVFLKEFFEIVDEKNWQTTKKHEKLPSRQRVKSRHICFYTPRQGVIWASRRENMSSGFATTKAQTSLRIWADWSAP